MSVWSKWVTFIDRREDATSLAVARIISGATVFWQFLTAWTTGAASAMWLDEQYGGVRRLDRPGALAWFGGGTPHAVSGLIIVGLISSALMTVGAFGPISSALTWFAFRTAAGLNDESGGSADDLLVNALFILMLSGCHRSLSLDARWFRRSNQILAWPRYVLIGQLVALYSATALQKVSSSWLPWGPLDALWYILQQPTWQRVSMHWLAPVYVLTQLATAITWLFELSAPLLLLAFYYRATRDQPGRVRAWFNRVDYRRAYLVVGLMLHVGIWLSMEVGPFLSSVLILYACCVHPSEWKPMIVAVRSRLRLRPAASTSP